MAGSQGLERGKKEKEERQKKKNCVCLLCRSKRILKRKSLQMVDSELRLVDLKAPNLVKWYGWILPVWLTFYYTVMCPEIFGVDWQDTHSVLL